MEKFHLNPDENTSYLVHRIKQINVLKMFSDKTLLILLLNLYNRSSIISFYQNNKKILSNYCPSNEIIKIKLTNLVVCDTYLEGGKKNSFLIILNPFSIVLYHIFLQKKIREIQLDSDINSHKYSFDDFIILNQQKENNPNFFILTSTNNFCVKIWDIYTGSLIHNFTTNSMNKHFLQLYQRDLVVSINCSKIFNQTTMEMNLWNWKVGKLEKKIEIGSQFRSLIQIEKIHNKQKSPIVMIGGAETSTNYKIHFFNLDTEEILLRIENLTNFNYFCWSKSGRENKEKIMFFNKNSVSNCDFADKKQKSVLSCKDDRFNFITGVFTKNGKVVIGKGLQVYIF